ncbi:endonuclease V [Novipirellula sp. SH528]|uniref:endonuclease V n=1 Tax=Novipirellula sp. SH528 TaxID=3454466 RepID=UPI003F9F31BD
MTIACIDVGYTDSESDPTTAIAACTAIADWKDAVAASEHVISIANVRDYQPGQFYLRELPCIEAVLAELKTPPSFVVVDGYVWLDDQDHPGLGKYLYDALNQIIPVIGVAKNPFKQSHHAHALLRGGSTRPLYITSVGIPVSQAASNIAAMHGPHRYPTILKRVDRLSRGEQPA